MTNAADHALGSAAAAADTTVAVHVWDFALGQEELSQVAVEIEAYLRELSAEASVPFYAINARAKTLASYAQKSIRTDAQGAPKYTDPATQIEDSVAARVIVFTTRARQDFVELLHNQCQVRSAANPGDTKHNGYDSDHLVISGISKSPAMRYPGLAEFFRRGSGLEIQIRTVAGHAWAEYEHDVRYKSVEYQELGDQDRAKVDQWFVEAGGLRRYLDQVFNSIDEFLLPTDLPGVESTTPDEDDIELLTEKDGRHLDPASLAEFIRKRHPKTDLGSVAGLQELLDHLTAAGITTIADLEAELALNDGNDVAARMDYPSPVAGVRLIDDELLASLAHQWVESALTQEREQLLRVRLRRVNGRFAIYVIEDDDAADLGPITAARTVRELARLVAMRVGFEKVVIPGSVSTDPTDLLPSTHPRVVKTDQGQVYVATNLSRSTSEELMEELVSKLPQGSVRVLRAGDPLTAARD